MKKHICFLFILIMVLQISCSKIFDRKPLDKISSADVWTNEQLIDANLAYLYSQTPFDYGKGSFNTTIPAALGGEATNGSSANMSWIQGNITNTGGVMEFWAYPQIRQLNEFIENVAQAPIDTAVRRIRVAEARFIRAFDYFEMVKRYGGVPVITKVQSINAPHDLLFVHRNSEKEVYDFIASECDAIADILPASYDAAGYGRATKYAALALGSRAMLFAGSIAAYGTLQLNGLLGFPSNEAQQYWQKSYDASMKIINSRQFALYDKYPDDKAKNYQELFLDDGNDETVFSVVFGGLNKVGNSFDYYNFPGGFQQDWGGTTSVYLETVEKYGYTDGRSGELDRSSLQDNEIGFDSLFKDKDPRFFASVLYPGAPFQNGYVYSQYGTYIDGTLNTAVTPVGAYNGDTWYAQAPAYTKNGVTCFPIKKFINEAAKPQPQLGEGTQDYMVFRYGEILLNLAEAAFELGKPDEALKYVNELRDRAGMPAYTTVDLNEIRHERTVELAFEGHNFWDLRRWRIADSVLSLQRHGLQVDFNWNTKKYKVQVINADHLVRHFDPKEYYFPITVSRIANNPNLAPENPGY